MVEITLTRSVIEALSVLDVDERKTVLESVFDYVAFETEPKLGGPEPKLGGHLGCVYRLVRDSVDAERCV